MKVIFKAHYGAFNQGEEYELREVFARQLIEDGVVEQVLEPPKGTLLHDTKIFSEEAAKALRTAFEQASRAGFSISRAIKVLGHTFGATKSQRHAMIVMYSELSEEIADMEKSHDKAMNSESLGPWIREALKLDLIMKRRTRSFIMDCIIKNKFPK